MPWTIRAVAGGWLIAGLLTGVEIAAQAPATAPAEQKAAPAEKSEAELLREIDEAMADPEFVRQQAEQERRRAEAEERRAEAERRQLSNPRERGGPRVRPVTPPTLPPAVTPVTASQPAGMTPSTQPTMRRPPRTRPVPVDNPPGPAEPSHDEAPVPDGMRLDARQLPTVDQRELDALESEIKANPPAPPAQAQPGMPSADGRVRPGVPGRRMIQPGTQPAQPGGVQPGALAPPPAAAVQPGTPDVVARGPSSQPAGAPMTPSTPGVHPPMGGVPGSQPANAIVGTPGPTSNAPKDATIPRHPQTGAPNLAAELKKQSGWWTLPPKERPYFFSWKNASFEDMCRDLQAMTGMSMIGLGSLDVKAPKPITFESVKIMKYDEALLQFNQIIFDLDAWVIQRDSYLEIRRLTEWYRHIPPTRIYRAEKDYDAAKLPDWDMASVSYEPKQQPAQMLAERAVDLVPVNAARATTVPNSNTIELKGFVYFLNQQLEYLHLIDVDTGGDGRELRVYPLKYASSQDAAQDLRQILPPTEGGVSITNAPAVPGGGRRGGPPGTPPGAPAPAPAASVAISSADMVDINDDSRLNRLLIRATPSKHKMVAEYLEKFIDLPLEKIGQLEVIKIEHTSPTKLAEMIRPMLGEQKMVEVPQPVAQPGHPPPPPQPPRIINVGTTAVLTPLEQSRSLLVKAKSDEMARVKEFIKLLDVPADEGAYKYIVLKHGSASNIAGVLSTAFSSRGSSGGRVYGGVSGGTQDADFRAIPDVANDRALILMGNKKDIDDATKLIADLDVDPEAGAVEHLVHLKYATPTDVAMTLMTRFGAKAGGGGYSGYGGGYGRGYRSGGMGSSDGGLPKFIPDDSSKTLIVLSTPEMWMDIERVMKELDKNADVDKTTKLYKLKHAGAGTVSQILTESFGGGGGRSRWGMGYGGSDSSDARFRFDPQTNVVIVAAKDEIHEKVAALIQQLDQPSAADQAELRVIQLKTAEAQYVIDKLEELFPEAGGRRGRRGGFGEYGMYGMGLMGDSAPKVPILLVAEPVSNRILITSSEEDFKKAEKYAKEIDDLYAAQEFVRKTFILQNAEADEVRNAVETMFTSGGGSGGRRRWWEPSSSSTPGSIKMTEVGNGLVVSAPKDQMAEIEKFIALLDTNPSGKNEIRSYKVQNADYQGTSEIARNLEQLYSVGRGGWDRRGSRETVRFIGSYGSDILMVSAPPEKMAEIDPIVQQMIKQSGPDTSMVIRHYELKDARPDDVADMLEPILQARFQELKEKSGGRRGGGWYGGFGGMADGPRVTAHKAGRRIMVSAPESLLPLVDELLKEFDRPAEPSTMRMIALKTARAQEIAEIVEEQVNSSSGGSPWGGRRGRGGFRGEWSPWGGGMMSRSSGSGDAERLSATPVESSNTIILRGPNEKVAEAERLVLSLDAQAKPEGPVLRVFALQYADLYDVVSALEDIAGASEAGGYSSSDYDYSYTGYGSSGGRRRSRSSAPVVIQAEYSGKRIIVSAPQDKFPLIEEIIKMKEELAKPTEDTETSSRGTVVNSRRGNITKVYDVQGSAETIAKYLDRILIDLIGYSDSPYVKSFPIANQVIVEGKPEHFTLVEEWLVRLEKQKIRAPVTMSVKQVPKGTNVARVVEMMQQAAPAEMQNRFKVSAIPKAAGRKNPLGMLNEIRYDDPIVEPEFRTATQPAVPVSGSGVRATSLNHSPVLAPTSPFRELTDSIARLGWAAGVKITVAEPATQPATAAASQPAAAPATRPAAVEAPATQPAATPVSEPAASAPPAPVSEPAAAAPAPAATSPVAAGLAPQPAGPSPEPVTAPPPPPPVPVAPAPAAPAAGEHSDRPRVAQDVEWPHPSPRSDLAARAPLEPEMSAEELAKMEIGRAAAEAYQTGNVQIKYDEESGLVYFLGDPSEVKELQDTLDKIIENFEALQEAPSDVRVFRLKYLDVSIAATILEQMFNDKQPAQPKKGAQAEAKKPQGNSAKDKKEEGDEDGQGGKRRRDEEQARKEAEQAQAAPGGQRIRVFPNPRDQTLIVRAAKEDFLPVAELLLKIDRPSDKPPVDIKIFQLKKLNAYEVEQAIKAILKIEDRTRTLRARPSMMRPGMQGMMANADALIEQLEQEMLEMQASGVLGGDGTGPGAEGDAKGKLKLNPAKEITITSDATTNSIIVSAPQDGMKLVEKLIDNLEAQDIPSQIKTFPLKYGDAEKVSTELQKIFRAGGEGGGGGGGRMGGGEGIRPSRMGAVTVAADSRTNTIVVRALAPDMEKVEPIITKLDVAPDKGQAQVYNIENADATSLAETLRAAFVDDPKATGSLATRITPNSETNTIVVWAPDAQQKLIAEKIQELDGQAGDSAKPRQIQLKVANASTVADKLKEIFLGSRAGAGGARSRGKQRVTIVGEDSSKMLFVTAPNAIFEEIKALAETMDKTTTSDIQVFKLKHATAQEVLSRFKEMMIQVTRSGGGAIASDVYAVTADERTNSLIVAGTPATFLAVTKVLADLDAPPPDVTTVTTQMFTLVRGQATSVAATINALHSGKQFVHGMLPPKAAAEASANVVYVTGTRAQIDEIKNKIIDPLEGAIPQPPAAVTVNDYQIPLKYANAEEVAETLDKMFQKRFAALTKSGTSVAPAEMTVSITPEPSTKRLLVTCSANNKKAIDDLLLTLDVEGATPRGQQTRVIPVKVADLGYTVQALTATFAKTGSRVPANEQVTIAPEYGTQSIIIKAPVDEMEQITKLLQQIDNPDANQINPPETVRVQHVRASDLARLLTDMIARTKRPDRNTRQYPVTVTADDSSNTLLLTANTPKDMDEIKGMVKQLDSQPAVETERVVKSYPLRYADLTSMTAAITARFKDNEKRPIQDQVTLTPDAANVALMVSASPANHEKVSQIIKELDVSNFDKVAAPRIVRLKFAKASEVATTMNAMVQRSKKRDQKTGMYPITVQGDDSSNTLIVTANETDMREAELLIKELDTQPAMDTERVVKSYPLRYADLQSVNTAITTRFQDNAKRPIQDQVSLTPDYANMALLVTASSQNHEKVSAIIKDLDVSNFDHVAAPKIVRLQFAKASEVAATMNAMVQRSKKRDQKTGMYPITVQADDSSNTLIVTANETDMREAEGLITQLDIEPPTETARVVKSYPLRYADLQSTTTAITARYQDNAKRPIHDQVSLTPDYANMALLVTASPKNHEKVSAIIKELDISNLDRVVVPKTVVLKHAKASDVATTMNAMIQRSKKRDQKTGLYPITAAANDSSNTLVITANETDMKEAEALIAQLDIEPPTDKDRTVKPYPLQYAELQSVITAITARFSNNTNRPIQDQVTFTADATNNALLVTASAENHEKVAKIVSELDTAEIKGSRLTAPETVIIRNVLPSELVKTLDRMIKASMKIDKRTGTYPVTVSPNDAAGVLLVTANNDESMKEIKALIAQLDIPQVGQTERAIKAYPIQYADLTAMQKVIDARFEANKTLSQRDQVVTSIEPATGTLVITASAENHEKIAALIKEMDVSGTGVPHQEIIRLKNARAVDLYPVLQATYRTKGRAGQQPPAFGADTNSNAIVVSANKQDMAAIKELVAELDKPVDEANVEELRVITLEFIDAVETQKIMAEYLRKPGTTAGRGSEDLVGGVRIQASPLMNALVVSGASSSIDRVQKVVQGMDKEMPGAGTAPKIIPIQHGSAAQLATTLTRMFTEPAEKNRSRTTGVDTVPLIMADDSTNSLVVRARTVDYKMIEEMAGKLDTKTDMTGMEVLQLPRGISARQLASEIEKTVNAGEQAKQRQQPGYKPGQIAIGVDERVPALMVAGSPSLFPTVKQLVDKLQEMKPTSGMSARVVRPANIAPQDMKKVLDQLIEQQRSGGQKTSHGR